MQNSASVFTGARDRFSSGAPQARVSQQPQSSTYGMNAQPVSRLQTMPTVPSHSEPLHSAPIQTPVRHIAQPQVQVLQTPVRHIAQPQVQVLQTPVRHIAQPQVQVLQAPAPRQHHYNPNRSFLSNWNPFNSFFNPTPSVLIVDSDSSTRIWTRSPVSLLASSIALAILGVALFSLGVAAVDPLFLVLGSILTISAAAGIIKSSSRLGGS